MEDMMLDIKPMDASWVRGYELGAQYFNRLMNGETFATFCDDEQYFRMNAVYTIASLSYTFAHMRHSNGYYVRNWRNGAIVPCQCDNCIRNNRLPDVDKCKARLYTTDDRLRKSEPFIAELLDMIVTGEGQLGLSEKLDCVTVSGLFGAVAGDLAHLRHRKVYQVA